MAFYKATLEVYLDFSKLEQIRAIEKTTGDMETLAAALRKTGAVVTVESGNARSLPKTEAKAPTA